MFYLLILNLPRLLRGPRLCRWCCHLFYTTVSCLPGWVGDIFGARLTVFYTSSENHRQLQHQLEVMGVSYHHINPLSDRITFSAADHQTGTYFMTSKYAGYLQWNILQSNWRSHLNGTVTFPMLPAANRLGYVWGRIPPMLPHLNRT